MINGMKGSDILRIVDALHREKGVDKTGAVAGRASLAARIGRPFV